jgi:uncharacterized membrane protein
MDEPDGHTTSASGRLWEVDLARGIALGSMLLFNWTYALAYLDVYAIVERSRWLYWDAFPRFIAFMFVFIVGVSLTLSVNRLRERVPEGWQAVANRKYPARGLRILGLGIGITVVTYWYAPERFIYFGILHLIGVAIVLARPLLVRRWAALLAGVATIALGPVVASVETQSRLLASLGLSTPHPSFDYFPVFPWIGVAFLGIWTGHTLFPRGQRRFDPGAVPAVPVVRQTIQALQFLGRHTLVIYLTHQPALIVVLALLGYEVL